ncbi:hypothetical protein H6A60_04620 [Sutterella massiliensis]|uniref:Uncharacterized protein n=1 Tax=Sutterella massiliensis TaxID=1816689 RepID=A0ABS2DR29_9BURK|nr:hypothetical protein [Sutterella massiliensis]MBM6703770.1 hypothetical protein [Sutterella massiliensis]
MKIPTRETPFRFFTKGRDKFRSADYTKIARGVAAISKRNFARGALSFDIIGDPLRVQISVRLILDEAPARLKRREQS